MTYRADLQGLAGLEEALLQHRIVGDGGAGVSSLTCQLAAQKGDIHCGSDFALLTARHQDRQVRAAHAVVNRRQS